MRMCLILYPSRWISLIMQCNLKIFYMSSMAFQVHQALLVPRGLLVLQAPYCLIMQS